MIPSWRHCPLDSPLHLRRLLAPRFSWISCSTSRSVSNCCGGAGDQLADGGHVIHSVPWLPFAAGTVRLPRPPAAHMQYAGISLQLLPSPQLHRPLRKLATSRLRRTGAATYLCRLGEDPGRDEGCPCVVNQICRGKQHQVPESAGTVCRALDQQAAAPR